MLLQVVLIILSSIVEGNGKYLYRSEINKGRRSETATRVKPGRGRNRPTSSKDFSKSATTMNGAFSKIITYFRDSTACHLNVPPFPDEEKILSDKDARRYRRAQRIKRMNQAMSECEIITEISDVTSMASCDDESECSISSSGGSSTASSDSSGSTSLSESLASTDSSVSSTFIHENMYCQIEILTPGDNEQDDNDKYSIHQRSAKDKYVTMGEIRESMSIDGSRDGNVSLSESLQPEHALNDNVRKSSSRNGSPLLSTIRCTISDHSPHSSKESLPVSKCKKDNCMERQQNAVNLTLKTKKDGNANFTVRVVQNLEIDSSSNNVSRNSFLRKHRSLPLQANRMKAQLLPQAPSSLITSLSQGDRDEVHPQYEVLITETMPME